MPSANDKVEASHLVDYVNESVDVEEDFHFLRFEFLQRINIVKLEQCGKKFARLFYQISIEALDRKIRLQRYFHAASEIGDPWESHYSYFKDGNDQTPAVDPLRSASMRYLPSRLTFSRQEREARVKEYSEGKQPWQVSRFVDRLTRFIVALTGGIFLLIPMIFMTLNPSETKSLITVSVAVVIFSLILWLLRVSAIGTGLPRQAQSAN